MTPVVPKLLQVSSLSSGPGQVPSQSYVDLILRRVILTAVRADGLAQVLTAKTPRHKGQILHIDAVGYLGRLVVLKQETGSTLFCCSDLVRSWVAGPDQGMARVDGFLLPDPCFHHVDLSIRGRAGGARGPSLALQHLSSMQSSRRQDTLLDRSMRISWWVSLHSGSAAQARARLAVLSTIAN